MWNFELSNVELLLQNNLLRDIECDMTEFDMFYLTQIWSNLPQKYWSKIPTDINVLSCESKAAKISNVTFLAPLHTNLRSMYARVPQAMAQFFLQLEKLSHIIGTQRTLTSI